MLPHLFKWLAHEVYETVLHNPNQFASGGLLIMALGGLAAYMRNIPRQIYEWALHLFSMTLVINDESKAYIWFKWWFQTHKRSKKIRHVDVITPYSPQGVEVLLSPAPGSHWFVYRGRPFRMTITRTEEKTKMWTDKRPETMTLRVIGRDQKFLHKFVQDIRDKYEEKNHSLPQLHFWNQIEWYSVPFFPRLWDSVILPKEKKDDIVKDIDHFLKNKAWYESTGMPYHRAYMFYGPPGTGKTSTLLGLANYFKLNLYLFKLLDMTDATLLGALRQVEKNSMIVFEDIDALKNKRADVVKTKEKKVKKKEEEQKAASHITLSGLLNCLDGIETPPGSLFFMTTNRQLKDLDAALTRPGRLDKSFYLGPATPEQKLEMYARFFPEDTGVIAAGKFISQHPKATTMAEFQEELKLKKAQEE